MEDSTYLYPFFREQCQNYLNKNHFDDVELSYRVYEDYYILPPDRGWNGGVIDKNKEFVEDTSMHADCCNVIYNDVENYIERNDNVIYLGLMDNCWGHCITDCLSRLWFIKYSNEYRNSFHDYKIVYICATGLLDNFKELLSILGVESSNWERVKELTKFKKIIIPDRCFFNVEDGTRFYTKEYRQMIDEIRTWGMNNLQGEKTGQLDKVYLSHSRYKRQFGEERLEAFFSKQGYAVIHPEEYTFKQQLSILLRCRFLASTIGSCSHNIVFMNNSASIILIPRANYLTGYQLAVDSLWNQKISFIDSSLSVMAVREHPWGGPFYYYVSQNLMDFFGKTIKNRERYLANNLKDFKRYINKGLIGKETRYSCTSEYFGLGLFLYRDYLNSRTMCRIEKSTCELLRKIKHSILKFTKQIHRLRLD